jgi:hypothetical protein
MEKAWRIQVAQADADRGKKEKGAGMTQDEIIEMAKQAGFQTGFINYMSGLGGYPFVKVIGTGEVLPNLERFAKLVAAKEREACALICDEHADDPVYCGEAIRARGEA